MSYSLIPQSLLDAMKCIPPLEDFAAQTVCFIKNKNIKNLDKQLSEIGKIPQAIVYFNSICDGIVIVCRPGTETHSFFIKTLQQKTNNIIQII